MALIELGEIMFGEKLALLQWFQSKGLISSTKQFHRCSNGTMTVLKEKSDVADGYK